MLVALYSIPKITLYPIVLLAFGIGMPAKIAFGAIHGIVPIAIFALGAVRNLNPVYAKAARVMRMPPAQIASRVLLPAAIPEIFTGIRIGFSLTLIGTLLGEMFASQRGLGYLLIQAIGLHNVRVIMALTLLLVVIAVTASALLLAVDRRLRGRAVGHLLVDPLHIILHPLAQRRRVDLMHAARAGEIERVRGRRAHRDARAHHAHAGKRRDIAVDVAPGRDHVVALGRHQAAERHGVQVIVAETPPTRGPAACRAARSASRCARPHRETCAPARTSSTVSCWRPTIQRVWRTPSMP